MHMNDDREIILSRVRGALAPLAERRGLSGLLPTNVAVNARRG